MEKSTPISHLRRDEEGPPQDDAAAMMEHMVNDVEGGGGQPPQERGMPGQPMPGYGGGGGGYDNEGMMDPRMMDPRMMGGPPPGYGGPHPGYGGGMHGGPGPRQQQQMPGLENASFTQKLMTEVKEPLLVSVLVIILSSNQVGGLIGKFLPIADKNPLIGLMVRAGIAGLAFWLLRRFIPTGNK